MDIIIINYIVNEFCFVTTGCGTFEYKDLDKLTFCVDYNITEIITDDAPAILDGFKCNVLNAWNIGKIMTGVNMQ